MIPLPRAALFCIQDTASIVRQKRRVTGSTPATESLHAKEEQKTQHAATVCAARCKGQRSALHQPPQRIAFSGSLLCRMLSFPFQRTTTRTDVHEEPCCQGSFFSFEEAASGSTISVHTPWSEAGKQVSTFDNTPFSSDKTKLREGDCYGIRPRATLSLTWSYGWGKSIKAPR